MNSKPELPRPSAADVALAKEVCRGVEPTEELRRERLEAVGAKWAAEHPLEDLQLRAFGEVPPMELRPELERRAAEIGLERHCDVAEARDQAVWEAWRPSRPYPGPPRAA